MVLNQSENSDYSPNDAKSIGKWYSQSKSCLLKPVSGKISLCALERHSTGWGSGVNIRVHIPTFADQMTVKKKAK